MAMLRLSSSKLLCQGRIQILPGILSHTSIRREKVAPFASSHSFSTDSSDDAKKQMHSDGAEKQINLELPQILDTEMDARKKILETPMPKVPGDFPEFPFTVREDHCSKNITMTRNFYDEKITVVVYMPDHMDDEKDDDSLGVSVTVRKENGNIMRLFLFVDQQQITVQNVCFENECDAEIDVGDGMREDGMMHLQDGLRKYLEARGIKKDYYPFLKECMIHNSRKLRLRALNKLRGFVTD